MRWTIGIIRIIAWVSIGGAIVLPGCAGMDTPGPGPKTLIGAGAVVSGGDPLT